MCNPCICGRAVHLTIQILQRGEIPHSVSRINVLEMRHPRGPCADVQTSVSFLSTALEFTGKPGSGTWCSETLS